MTSTSNYSRQQPTGSSSTSYHHHLNHRSNDDNFDPYSVHGEEDEEVWYSEERLFEVSFASGNIEFEFEIEFERPSKLNLIERACVPKRAVSFDLSCNLV